MNFMPRYRFVKTTIIFVCVSEMNGAFKLVQLQEIDAVGFHKFESTMIPRTVWNGSSKYFPLLKSIYCRNVQYCTMTQYPVCALQWIVNGERMKILYTIWTFIWMVYSCQWPVTRSLHNKKNTMNKIISAPSQRIYFSRRVTLLTMTLLSAP